MKDDEDEHERQFPSDDKKKSARELRQRRSDYRCCLPALAGFVCLQSTVPDGDSIMERPEHRAINLLEKFSKRLANNFSRRINTPHDARRPVPGVFL